MNLSRYLEVNPAVCHGQVVFKGTRIMVYLVLELLESGVSIKEIISEDYYPQLTEKHIQAVLHYTTNLIKTAEFIPFAKA